MESRKKYFSICMVEIVWEVNMDTSRIQYRQGMPFYPVTFPMNEADGLVIEDLCLPKLLEYLKCNEIKSAYVCSMNNFDFLEQCKQLEHITIELRMASKYYSTLDKKGKGLLKTYTSTPLYQLRNLKSLSIIDTEEPFIFSKFKVDLSKFDMLEEFCGDAKYIEKVEDARELKSLWLNYYEEKSLDKLSGLKKLDSLKLISSKIESLKGCDKLIGLQCLYLHYNRALSDISELKYLRHSLKALRIENCSKIKDFSVLEELEELELLELCGSNKVPNISFIKKMKKLKTFVFTVDILDGDLSSCLDLQYVFCGKGRKYYNLKDGKLPKGEYVRGNENIEMWRRFE